MRVQTADGVDLAVYDFGGDGPPLLLAHATGYHARCWLPVVERLRDSFHCFAFDERAHGDSTPPPDGDFDWWRFGGDALAVLDGLGLSGDGGGVFGAGHSCGATLLLLAELTRPGTFRGLYCFEPVIIPMDEAPPPEAGGNNALAAGARRRRSEFDSVDDALAHYAARRPFSAFDPAALRAYVEHGVEAADGGVRLKCRGEDEARVYEAGPYHRAYSRLAEVQCPVALSCGEATEAFDEAFLRLYEARLPRATVEVIPAATHFGPLEQPAVLADRIRAALLG